MDEPLSNLDAKLRVQTRSQIATLQAKLGITTVYVTHDQVEAMTMGHRVAVMLDGELQQCDTPRTLYDNPENVFVAGFIGSPAMNLKTVALTESGAEFGSLAVPLNRDQMSSAQGGDGKVTVGFRPEATDVVTPNEGGLPIVVDLVEDLGSDANVYGHAELEGGAERFVVRTDRRHMPHMGETVYIKPQANQVHLFNAVTGHRI
jgi:multiple sugar transport system ATP-binding protein